MKIVVGAGPLGLAIARKLVASGETVRVVTRAGTLVTGCEAVAADVADAGQAIEAFRGGSVVFQCAAPRYSQWLRLMPQLIQGTLAGARESGASVVYGDNLYAYGRVSGPITEDLPARPIGPNTRTRAEVAEAVLRADDPDGLRTTIGRASDFYGRGVTRSIVGEQVFGRLKAGKPPQVLGNPDLPHTLTFVEDFADGLLTLAANDASWGEVWHVPSAPTIKLREFISLAASAAGAKDRITKVPSAALAVAGAFSPDIRAVREVLYQSREPWVVDHSKFADAFGARPTEHAVAIARC